MEDEIYIKDMSRAKRRHHVECLKKKRSEYYSWGDTKTPTEIGKLVHTVPNCSCHMCGNPRKHFNEITMQEKRHLEYMKDQLNS